MKKLAMSISAATLIMGSLAGCGADNGTQEGQNRNGDYRQVGFQTTQEQNQNNRGFFSYDRAGEGPITDMFTRDDDRNRGYNTLNDRNRNQRGYTGTTNRDGENIAPFGTSPRRGPGVTSPHITGRTDEGIGTGLFGERRDNNRYGTNQPLGDRGSRGEVGDRPGMVDDNGILRGGRTGMTGLGNNYSGQTGLENHGQNGRTGTTPQRHADTYWPAGNKTARLSDGQQGTKGLQQGENRQQENNYHKDYDSTTAQQITKRVNALDNVEDARVIVHDDVVLVAVETEGQNANDIEKNIEQTVKKMADNKQVRVVTDREDVTRVRTMDDDLRGGAAFEEVGATFQDMVGDLGRMLQRPFERSR